MPTSRDDWQRAVRKVRHLAGPTSSFVDLRPQVDRSVLVVSSGRSGSTWLAEAVNFDNRYRMIFEPFRERATPLVTQIAHGYLAPGQPDPEVRQVFDRLLRGRLRGSWGMDQHNHKRVATRRLVKEIRINNLVPWLCGEFPSVPVLYLVRHPLAVVASQHDTRDDWALPDTFFDAIARPNSPFEPFADRVAALRVSPHATERMALSWCLQNYLALSSPDSHCATFALFEDLVVDPEAEFTRLLGALGRPFDPGILRELGQPSTTTIGSERQSGRQASALVERWRDSLDQEDRRRVMAVVEAFGLSHLYGDDPMPQVKAAQLRPG